MSNADPSDGQKTIAIVCGTVIPFILCVSLAYIWWTRPRVFERIWKWLNCCCCMLCNRKRCCGRSCCLCLGEPETFNYKRKDGSRVRACLWACCGPCMCCLSCCKDAKDDCFGASFQDLSTGGDGAHNVEAVMAELNGV
jgi:hypothetical protein